MTRVRGDVPGDRWRLIPQQERRGCLSASRVAAVALLVWAVTR